MRVTALKENRAGEQRAALVPDGVRKLTELGYEVSVESGLGDDAGFRDADYIDAGASTGDLESLSEAGDIVLRVRAPELHDIASLKPGCVHISFLDPFNETSVIRQFAERNVTAVSLEMLPRTTLAQKMDALSSQSNLSGYASVILAAQYLPRIYPMMMTPAGTLPPARVFIIGAGVAGLQAIATAQRLGARVEAFDTRPVVAEQVRSLGARFVEIDVGETGQTDQGYARELTEEQLDLQRQGMARVIARSDVVITTAQVFGRPAPRIVSTEMVSGMRHGSVVVDLAVESGGNVECSEQDSVVDVDGVQVIGLGNFPSFVATHASEMFSANLVHYISHFTDGESGELVLNPADEIVESSVVARDGQIVNDADASN